MALHEDVGPILNGIPTQLPDIDPDETQEWLDVLRRDASTSRGRDACALPDAAPARAGPRDSRSACPPCARTDYINTIPPEREPWFPGDEDDRAPHPRLHPLERRGDGRPPRQPPGHRRRRAHLDLPVLGRASTRSASTTSSAARTTPAAATRSSSRATRSPGIYARAFLEGRLTEEQLDGFRQEKSSTARPAACPSYPHPRLMPDFWEFPTVSMGLGPINSIYQAQFNRYLHNRGIKDTSEQQVWAFLGDGEMDEPESLRRAPARRPRGARQPHLRHQLQPPAPRRPGPRQRQDHPGAGVVLPRRRLERHQGRLGPRVGRAARRGRRRRRWST